MLSCYISLLYRSVPFPLFLVSSYPCFFFSLFLLYLVFSFVFSFSCFSFSLFFSLFFVFAPVQQLESIQLHASDNFDELSKQKKKVRNTLDLIVSSGFCFFCYYFCFYIWQSSILLSSKFVTHIFPEASMLYSIIWCHLCSCVKYHFCVVPYYGPSNWIYCLE